jgi:L-ascorbate metabolism protein UlaG (beta-lactamase superfamily)
MSLIKPLQQDDALLTDIATAAREPDKLHIWWLGQSGFLLQHRGSHLLFDPYLSDSLTEKYALTDKPHVRLSERVIFAGHLQMVDVVTASHNHTDHLDANTLFPLFAANWSMKFVIAEANRAFVAGRLCLDGRDEFFGPDWPIGMTAGQTIDVDGWTIHGIPAAHNEREFDEQGRDKFMGFVAERGPYRVYHSGDTLWFDGLAELLRPFAVDVAFLPINGNRPERRVAGNLNADEAARLGREIGAKLVVPHHYDLFAFNTADPAEFERACAEHKTPNRVMQLGERITV